MESLPCQIFQKIGGVAAWINAAVSVATLIVTLGLIGLPAIADNQKLLEMAIANPTPLIVQDVLKLVSATLSIAIVAAMFNRLKGDAPKLASVATVFGLLSILCLLINASLSFYLVSQQANYTLLSAGVIDRLNLAITILALAVIFFDGIWYLLISWSALKYDRLPKSLSYLGLGMGLLSLLPPLGILVLLLSVGWLLWLGQVLLKQDLRTDTIRKKFTIH